MKKMRNIKLSSILAGFMGVLVVFSTANAQEYDDMYFNKSDRKTIKSEKKALVSADLKNTGTTNYNQATKSTEAYSAKNVNPEYIARYKATESNEVQEGQSSSSNYNSSDYFIENYNAPDSSIGIHQNQIDYAALNKRDQMSYSNYNNNTSNPYWRMNPYMNMGFGRPWGYSPYMMGYDPFMMGYDPFMMGYGPGMTMGMNYGFGTGFFPSMSYSIGMSWGTGYNPWGGWGGYPYSPYGMRGFNDPWAWGPSYGFGYSPFWGSSFGYGFNSFYGYPRPVYVINNNEYYNNAAYQPRTVRNTSAPRIATSNSENLRVSSADSKIRIPNNRTATTNTADGRISRDYSKSQNEYYNTSRRTASSSERIATSTSSRNSYTRTSNSATGYSSPISNTKPDRLSNSSSGINRSTSSYSNTNSRSSSSFSNPSRSSSSYDRSSYSSGNSSSSYSSGSRTSFSSGSSSGGTRSSGSSGATRSGGRQ
jgi:hypothetical protein